MNKSKKITLGIIIVAILLMAVGYAAISTITLTISGQATVAVDADNFNVYFSAVTTKDPDGTYDNSANGGTTSDPQIDATIDSSDPTKAIVNFNNGMTKAGDSEYVILEITNGSNGINASDVSVTTSSIDNTTYFSIDSVMCDKSGNAISDYSVASGATTYVKVTVTCEKTPTTKDVTSSYTVTLTATPESNT